MRCRCRHDQHAPGKCPRCECQRDDRPYQDPGPTPAWPTPPVAELCIREGCGHPESVHKDGPDMVCVTCYDSDRDDDAYHRFRRYDP